MPVAMRAQGDDGRGDGGGAAGGEERGDLLGDDLADGGDVGGALALVDLLGQPGQADQGDAGQLGDRRVDVVRQREVDDGERPLGVGPGAGDDGQRQHHAGRAGAGHQQVGVGQRVLHLR